MKHAQLTDELQERAILYAAGALDDDDRREFARHLEEDGCAVCRTEARESEVAAQSLVMSLPVQTPSESVKRRLLAQAEAVSATARRAQPERRQPAFAWAGWLVAAASLVLLVVVFSMNTNLKREVAILTSLQTRVVNLSGQGETPQARGRIFWSEADHQWHFFVSGLPQTSNNRSYQLWFVPTTGSPVSARVFNTNPDGSADIEIPVPPEITELKAAAVTEEPDGGSPQPTGGFALLGSM